MSMRPGFVGKVTQEIFDEEDRRDTKRRGKLPRGIYNVSMRIDAGKAQQRHAQPCNDHEELSGCAILRKGAVV